MKVPQIGDGVTRLNNDSHQIEQLVQYVHDDSQTRARLWWWLIQVDDGTYMRVVWGDDEVGWREIL